MTRMVVDARKIARENLVIRVRVRGLYRLRLRVRIASWIFRIGAKVAGIPLDLSVDKVGPGSLAHPPCIAQLVNLTIED